MEESRADDLRQFAKLVRVERPAPELQVLQLREGVEDRESARAALEHEEHFPDVRTIFRNELHLIGRVEKILLGSPEFLNR